MPTFITHAFAAYATGRIMGHSQRKILLTGMFCAMIPDADVLAFSFNIPYENMWGHRGITHSFFFAFLLTCWMMIILKTGEKGSRQWWMTALFLFFAASSHAILDAMTSGGKGVAFFAPFHNERYFLPWRPIRVSPFSASSFLEARGLRVLLSEFIWVWFPGIILLFFFRRK